MVVIHLHKLPVITNECKIELTGLTGNVILNKKIRKSSETTLDISELKNGIYLLEIHTSGKTYIRKIIKS
jgi:hypothetical protein